MSDAFIQHLIDKTLGTSPHITIRHAVRPDMLWRSYPQETSEDLIVNQSMDVSSNNSNRSNKRNSNSRNKLGKGVMPGQAPINDNDPEDAEQSKKGDGHVNAPHQMPESIPGKAGNMTRKVNKFNPPFSAMPKSIGAQDKMVVESQTASNRSESFLANSNGPEIDSGEAKKTPSMEEGNEAQRENNNNNNSVAQNDSHLRVEDQELHGGAKESQERSAGNDIVSPSTYIFDKKNAKPLPINNIQSDNPKMASVRGGTSSSEMNMKGGTRPQPLQSSHSAKQEGLPISKTNNDTSVTISIGRIEVKAISSQVQQQSSLAPKKALGLSLQEYIKMRDEGQL